MKNVSYIVNGILAVAVIILFILHFTSKSKNQSDSASLKFENDSTVFLPIAYVNVDTLLTKYNYAKDVRELLLNKSESSRASLSQKQNNLNKEQQEFQRKYQNNAFLSQERAEQEYTRIQKLATDFEQTAARLDNELGMEQLKYNSQLADSVRLCIKEYNKTANYHIVFSNTGLDNILYAKDKYDVTEQILNLLNSRYSTSKK